MKAISIKQPWASLIAYGIKDIENRTWRTNYRGRVLIHAGASKKEGWRLNDVQRFHLRRSGSSVESTSKCNYSHKNEIHPKIVIIKRKINKDLQTLK